ncbi:hypothetical protein V495_03792 [Pseudogymnoascus sp. VKM F-4514 (FW-929)]|nr:hypothetical protein V495_03792 [Pseudogymnoascus sp. VKM F-4514 (FW-929)]KFY55276.1 hypothetical protein V497_07100 [Pseudogymnoascus sp. VKM F-4516 (FW-969)]
MRLSTYFADTKEVFIYNLYHPDIQETLDGDYVIAYVQSIGGRFPPKYIHATDERMIRIMEFHQPGEPGFAAKSFIRYNNQFRNIRELILYPPNVTGNEVAVRNLTSRGNNPESLSIGDPSIVEEAGMRMQMSGRACLTLPNIEVDPTHHAHDHRLANLFADTSAIRQQGSIISFGMVIKNNKDQSGYEFCQVELAGNDGDRVLFVAIKIPHEDDQNVSSAFIKQQEQYDHMHEMGVHKFIEVDEGYYILKEYGRLGGDACVNLSTRSHEFYKLNLGDKRERELFQGYSRQVGRALLEPHQFNMGRFEEWRQMVPPQTIDQHLKDIHDLYTQEINMAMQKMSAPLLDSRMDSRGMGVSVSSRHYNPRASSNRNGNLRQTLHILRDGQMYVASRRRQLEYERRQEFEFANNVGDHPNENAINMPIPFRRPHGRLGPPRTATPELSNSGSTTPTNSPRRRAGMGRLTTQTSNLAAQISALAVQNSEIVSMNEGLSKIMNDIFQDPKFLAMRKLKEPAGSAEEEERLRLELHEEMKRSFYKVVDSFRAADTDGGADSVVEAGANGGADANAGAEADGEVDADGETDDEEFVLLGKFGAATGAATRNNADANAGTFVAVKSNTGATVGAVVDNDSEDDEDGGVKLTPEPVTTVQVSPRPATLSAPSNLDGQNDSGSPRPSKDTSLKRGAATDDNNGVSTRSVSPGKTSSGTGSSSAKGDAKPDSSGGTPDRCPSPKKRKLSHEPDDDVADKA